MMMDDRLLDMFDDVDFGGMSSLEDFELEDALENFLTSSDILARPEQIPMTQQSYPAFSCPQDAPMYSEGSATRVRTGAPLPGQGGMKRARPTVVPARRRSFKDYTKPVKRGFLNRQIPANDVRRHLAQMVIGAVNSHQPGNLETVLGTLCGPAVVMTSRFIGDTSALPFANAVVHRELHGVPHIAHYLDALFEIIPDALIRLLDSKVHMFQNGCSYIVGKFIFQGFKCYDLITQGDMRSAHVPGAGRGRALPGSKFDKFVPTQKASPSGVQEGTSDGLSDLEALLFESEDEEQEFFNPPSSSTTSSAFPQVPVVSSVALEHHPVEYLVAHPSPIVQEVSLRFLGTIAFYLDPEAKIFKVEVLNTMEDKEGTGQAAKKARKC
jgi:hypothetical protein